MEREASDPENTLHDGVTVEQVVRLLTGPNSEDLAVRHVVSINKFCASNAQGFYVRDLGKLCTILDVTVQSIKQGQATFEAPLQQILGCDQSQLRLLLVSSVWSCTASAVQLWTVKKSQSRSRQTLLTAASCAACSSRMLLAIRASGWFMTTPFHLCSILAKPLRNHTSTDEMKMAASIESMLLQVGFCLSEDVPTAIQLCACEVWHAPPISSLGSFGSQRYVGIAAR